MALKNPWEVSSEPKSVPVYADGKRIGTADRADVKLAGFYGPIKSVELTGLSERPTPVSLLQRNYDVMVRDQKIEELEAEVERLKESRKEQAEKHKQKMRNLQHNFKQQSNGKTRNTKLKKQLESSQSYNEHLQQCIREKDAELAELQAKLDSIPGVDSYWHEKYLESQEALKSANASYLRAHGRCIDMGSELSDLRSENKKLVDDYNRLNDDINCFMEDFSEGANAINRAVEDWNATVPE